MSGRLTASRAGRLERVPGPYICETPPQPRTERGRGRERHCLGAQPVTVLPSLTNQKPREAPSLRGLRVFQGGTGDRTGLPIRQGDSEADAGATVNCQAPVEPVHFTLPRPSREQGGSWTAMSPGTRAGTGGGGLGGRPAAAVATGKLSARRGRVGAGDRTGGRVWPGLPLGDVEIGPVIWEQWSNRSFVPAPI